MRALAFRDERPGNMLGSISMPAPGMSLRQMVEIQAKARGITLTPEEKANPGSPALLKKLGYTPSNSNPLMDVARGVTHGVLQTGRVVGHAVAESARVTERVVRRAALKVAKTVLSGESLGAGTDLLSRTQAKIAINTGTSTLVAATTTPVVAAAAQPLIIPIVSDVVDEIYDKATKAIQGSGGAVAPALKKAAVEVEAKESGSGPMLLMGAVAILAIVFLTGKKKAPAFKPIGGHT